MPGPVSVEVIQAAVTLLSLPGGAGFVWSFFQHFSQTEQKTRIEKLEAQAIRLWEKRESDNTSLWQVINEGRAQQSATHARLESIDKHITEFTQEFRQFMRGNKQ